MANKKEAIDANQPPLSGEGFTLQAQIVDIPKQVRESPTILQLHDPWNLEAFLTPRFPIVVGELQDTPRFSQTCRAYAVTMPIRLAGMEEYMVPIEFQQFEEAIQMAINYGESINQDSRKYNTYLTVDQRPVKANTSQRSPGLHIDGQQLTQLPNGTVPTEVEFAISDVLPTTFYPQQPIDFSRFDPTSMDAREAREKFNLLISEQTDRAKAMIGKPYTMYLFDSYLVHESTPSSVDTARTYVKVNFSPRILHTYSLNGFPTNNPFLQKATGYDWGVPATHITRMPSRRNVG